MHHKRSNLPLSQTTLASRNHAADSTNLDARSPPRRSLDPTAANNRAAPTHGHVAKRKKNLKHAKNVFSVNKKNAQGTAWRAAVPPFCSRKAPARPPGREGNIKLRYLSSSSSIPQHVMSDSNSNDGPDQPARRVARPFRLNARAFFITWARCHPLDARRVVDHVRALAVAPLFICAVDEQHADGGHHVHAVVGYARKRDITSARKCFLPRHVSHVTPHL